MSKFISVLDKYPDYEMNIGIEVHIQLNTKTKIFCACANQVSKEPNSNICQTCSGYLGTLPVFNQEVLDKAILLGLATNCQITENSEFARKHYFYPDLPKGYQITQSDKPICTEGYVTIPLEDGSTKKIRLMRIHMEEDAGKNTHAGGESFVDLNRAGTPLLESVTHPDIATTYEAKAYLQTLHTIASYLNISSGNMEEGAFRADTNLSVRKRGATKLGTRSELKNINSFKFIADAIEYEIERHIETLESGGKITQETRLWDSKEKKTFPMRSKEEAADYRYFPDPDLPLIHVGQEKIAQIRAQLPELPHEKFARLTKERNLSAYEAEIIVSDIELAHYFDAACKHTTSKSLINWVLRDVMGYLKEFKLTLAEFKVTPEKLAHIVEMVDNNTINNRAAKEVFEAVAQTGATPAEVVKEKGLEQVDSTEELEAIVKAIIAEHPEQVAEYKSGKDRMFGFFVGVAMKRTQGKGNPKTLQDLLKKHLA